MIDRTFETEIKVGTHTIRARFRMPKAIEWLVWSTSQVAASNEGGGVQALQGALDLLSSTIRAAWVDGEPHELPESIDARREELDLLGLDAVMALINGVASAIRPTEAAEGK